MRESVLEKRKEAILLAEDELAMRRALGTTLRRRGYEVIEAASGDEALTALGTAPADLVVICDCNMPGASVFAVAQAATQRTPPAMVLLTSGYSREALVQQGRELPETAFLAKPFTAQQLLAKVEEVIRAAAESSSSGSAAA